MGKYFVFLGDCVGTWEGMQTSRRARSVKKAGQLES